MLNVDDIITNINYASDRVKSLGTDYGDQNYDKSLDIIFEINTMLDKISSFIDNLSTANSEDKNKVLSALKGTLKPAIDSLKVFMIGRKNSLSADYDVLVMTGQLDQSMKTLETTTPFRANNEEIQMPALASNTPVESQEQETIDNEGLSQNLGRARVLTNSPASHNHMQNAV